MNEDHESLNIFLSKRPSIKYIFTGGKGGVGKTISAAGIATYFALKKEKTLLASLNPVHSLSSLFDQDLSGGTIKSVNGVDNLWAVEVDITEKVKKYKLQLSDRLRWFLKWADIPLKAEEFVDIAATNPAFEESAMFDETVDIMLEKGEEFERVIFDTAAVANAVRLLGLNKIYGLWLERMIESRKEALSLRVKLSFRKERAMEEVKKDPMMKDLLDLNEKIQKATKIFGDPNKTVFFFVTLPLALPIAVVKRFIKMVEGFNIPTGGVIVNAVLTKESLGSGEATEYLKNKLEEQGKYLDIIRKDLWEQVRTVIPLYSREIIGVDNVIKLSEDMFSWETAKDFYQ